MILHFFCCSDTHGKLPTLPSVEGIALDGTLHAGDVYNGAELSTRDRDDTIASVPGWVDPDVAEVGEWIESAGPVFVVRGNHDVSDPHHFFRRANEITGRVVRVAESLLIVGIGWHGERYYELPGESEIDRVLEGVRRQLRREMGIRDVVVVLTHYPPYAAQLFPVEVPESGWWHRCTRELIDAIRPIAVVQGHIHELRGKTALIEATGTTLVHPGKQGVVMTVDTSARSVQIMHV